MPGFSLLSLPFWLVLGLCVVLAAGLTRAALRGSRRRAWRVGASLAAVAGLWLLAFPPVRQVRQATAEAILLTDGYSPDTLRHLLQQLGPRTAVWRYTAPAADTPTLSNLPALRARLPHLRRLHVVGRGLPPTDLPDVGSWQLISHFSALPTGFQQAAWSRRAAVGQAWTVEGSFAGASGPVWIRLHAASAPRDSVLLPAGRGSFQLTFRPRVAGRAVYVLSARPVNVESRFRPEPLPLEVLPARPLRVVLLAAAPSFEFRFLKDYLARQGHTVSLRVGLSRHLSQTEFLNQPASSPDLTRLSPGLLSRTDVLLTDAASMAALPAPERAALRAALRAGRTGLLLLADGPELPRQLPARAAFALSVRSATAASSPQQLQWVGAPAAKATVPAVLRLAPEAHVLVSTAHQQTVAAARREGLGQVVVTTLSETFPWLLQGQPETYAAYWSQLLSAAAPMPPVRPTLELAATWPQPHTPLLVRTSGIQGPFSSTGPTGRRVHVAPQQDANVVEWTTGTLWADTSGWQQLRSGPAVAWAYIFGPQQWQAPVAAARREAAMAWAARQPRVAVSEAGSTAPEPWPRWWGFGLFLMGAALLWVEEKL